MGWIMLIMIPFSKNQIQMYTYIDMDTAHIYELICTGGRRATAGYTVIYKLETGFFCGGGGGLRGHTHGRRVNRTFKEQN
jgi:hypothetical protein